MLLLLLRSRQQHVSVLEALPGPMLGGLVALGRGRHAGRNDDPRLSRCREEVEPTGTPDRSTVGRDPGKRSLRCDTSEEPIPGWMTPDGGDDYPR